MRACAYTRICWIMILCFPLDYQSLEYLKAACAPFGRVLLVQTNELNKTRLLLQVLVLSPDRVPRSIVFSSGASIGGNGISWSCPCYVLNGNFPDAFPTDEDPIPPNGNPHPVHGPLFHGNNALVNWAQEHAGAGQEHQAELGIHQDNAHGNHNWGHVNQQNHDQVDDGWPEWIPAAPQPVQQQNQAMQHHPDQPQDSFSLDSSGSTAGFYRATGAPVMLSWPVNALGNSSAASSSTSSSSDEASSLVVPKPTVIQGIQLASICRLLVTAVIGANPPLVHPMPLPRILKRSWDAAFEPIIIRRSVLQMAASPQRDTSKKVVRKLTYDNLLSAPTAEQSNLAIVPYKANLAALMLRIWSENQQQDVHINSTFSASPDINDPMLQSFITFGSQSPSQDAEDSGSLQQPKHMNASTNVDDGQFSAIFKKKQDQRQKGLPPKPPKKTMAVTPRKVSTPVSVKPLRRSPRLNDNDGYQHVQLPDTPRKKRRQARLQSREDEAFFDELPKKEKLPGPIPIRFLQTWGIEQCSVPPSEVTEDVLMQDPKQHVSNEDTTEE